jgi:hypothetical protein
MANIDTVFIIYSYLSREELGLERIDNEASAYYLLHIFEENSLLPRNDLVKIYNDTAPLKMPSELPEGYIGPFENLKDINQYAFALCDIQGANQVALVSLQDFNETIKAVNTPSDFKQILLEHSNIVANPDKDKKKSLFGKLFS